MLRFCQRKVMVFHTNFRKFLKKSKMIESNFPLFLKKTRLQEVYGLFRYKSSLIMTSKRPDQNRVKMSRDRSKSTRYLSWVLDWEKCIEKIYWHTFCPLVFSKKKSSSPFFLVQVQNASS